MATQMAYYGGSSTGLNSPFQSRHASGANATMSSVNNMFLGAGVPRAAPGSETVRLPIPPGRHMFHPFNRPYPKPGQDRSDYDSKQLRKSSMRKTVDYNSSVIRMLETRTWQRDLRDRRSLQPDVCYYPELVPPSAYLDIPSNAITTRFTKVATNKIRCPVFCLTWTPEGRRLITGASSGEFTLWNGLTFNFETILQAHDSPVRSMVWSHNDIWMVTGDHGGYIKYWQSNMNNVKMFQAHKEAIRGISFSPTDQKLASCSDDGTVRIWDFVRCHEEKILRGHGADVKCVSWHPHKGLVVSGSKDNQQPVKLWDPKSGQSLATLHAHKSTVMDAKWNKNGMWLITASRDHLIKLFDIRRLDQELQTFRGHKKEASCLSWHPFHEELFCSGGSDGAIFFWNVGVDKEVGAIDQAHESLIWSLAWHPIGHILCSGSNDHTSKFWTRNRPGDKMRDKYNLNTLPPGVMPEDAELLDDHTPAIPGMGPEDKVDLDLDGQSSLTGLSADQIPGLDMEPIVQEPKPTKKVPYAKPIPRNFQAQWNESNPKKPAILPTPPHPPLTANVSHTTDDEEGHVLGVDPVAFAMEQLGRATLTLFGLPATDPADKRDVPETMQPLPLAHLPTPTAVIAGGTILPIRTGSDLERAVRSGEEELIQVLSAMGLKQTEEDNVSDEEPQQVSELDDEDSYPRSRTPVLDDSPNYRGHSGIGPTPSGGLLGDFPRDFQPRGFPTSQPIRHPLPPGSGQHHQPWQAPVSQGMGSWSRPPYGSDAPPPHQQVQPQSRFSQPQGPINRPYYSGPPQQQQQQQQYAPPIQQRGRSPMGAVNTWGGPGPMEDMGDDDMRYMQTGNMSEMREPMPLKSNDDDMRRMDGGYPGGDRRDNYGWGNNNYRGECYERNDEDYGRQHYQNYSHYQQQQQPSHNRWNQDGSESRSRNYGRGGGGGGGSGRRGRRGGGYNNY